MATGLKAETVRSGLAGLASLAGCLGAGYIAASFAAPARSERMLPWLAGRSLGIAGYVALVLVTAVGIWIRHPWRFRVPVVHPEVRLRVHATLGAAATALICGHVVAIALDRYAGVGWIGAVVPGMSHYRTVAVGLGVIAFEAMVVVSVSAALAGRLGGRHWLALHRLTTPLLVMAWYHGVLAGTDARALRPLYLATGAALVILLATRHLATEPTGAGVERSRRAAGATEALTGAGRSGR